MPVVEGTSEDFKECFELVDVARELIMLRESVEVLGRSRRRGEEIRP